MSVRGMLQLTWHLLSMPAPEDCSSYMAMWAIRTEAAVALGCTVGAAVTSHTPWHISTGQIPQAHGLCKHQSKHLFLTLTLTLTLAPVLQQP